jgi:hypothetical protein
MGADKNSCSKNSVYVPVATPRVTHKQAEGSTHLSRDPRTRIEKLGCMMETTTDKRSKTEHCNNLPKYTTNRSELPDQARAPPEDILGTFGKT